MEDAAVVGILLTCWVHWEILGASIKQRSSSQDISLDVTETSWIMQTSVAFTFASLTRSVMKLLRAIVANSKILLKAWLQRNMR
jgi:hypothetical protein